MAWMAVTTTLFDLIAAIHEHMEPESEEGVIEAVQYLFMSRRVRFLRRPPDDEIGTCASNLFTKATYVAEADNL